MGYGWESRHGLLQADNAAAFAAIALQTLADKAVYNVFAPITVLRVGMLTTTATTGVIAVVDFDKRVLVGSDTGRVSKFGGSLNVPIGTAIGQMVYKDMQADLNPGEQLVIKLGTASTAGGGVFWVEYIPRAEMPVNYAHMVRSV